MRSEWASPATRPIVDPATDGLRKRRLATSGARRRRPYDGLAAFFPRAPATPLRATASPGPRAPDTGCVHRTRLAPICKDAGKRPATNGRRDRGRRAAACIFRCRQPGSTDFPAGSAISRPSPGATDAGRPILVLDVATANVRFSARPVRAKNVSRCLRRMNRRLLGSCPIGEPLSEAQDLPGTPGRNPIGRVAPR